MNGYEEATKLFQQWDEDDPKWKSYQPLAKKMVSDSNAVALEKGLECCLAFAENCKTAPKTGGEVGFHLCTTQRTYRPAQVIEGVVSKAVAAPKTKTKELATQVHGNIFCPKKPSQMFFLQLILMYCEIEAHEKVIEQLLAGLANKNPKVIDCS